MLTPSPLRKRPLFPYDSASAPPDDDEDEDIFLQSPFKSPPHRYHTHPAKPLPIQTDDDEGGIFLSTPPLSTTFTPFPTSSSQPLRTPVKQVHRAPSHSYLSIKHLNAQPHPTTPAFGLGGTKRKESGGGNGVDFSTPLHQRVMTPLGISSAHNQNNAPGSSGTGVSFDRLAPLPAPRFTTPQAQLQHPQSKAETEVHLKRHTETMTKLRICDLDDSDDEVERSGKGLGFFSAGPGLGFDRNADSNKSKSHAKANGNANGHVKTKSTSLGRSLGASLLAIAHTKTKNGKGQGKDEEVVEAISPGGHVSKRRARSRPVSQELLESVVSWTPISPSPGQVGVCVELMFIIVLNTVFYAL
jgi:mitosis inhibitor protein kinase SWE1